MKQKTIVYVISKKRKRWNSVLSYVLVAHHILDSENLYVNKTLPILYIRKGWVFLILLRNQFL